MKIIDLKATYNLLPRRKLYRIVEEHLHREAGSIVASALQSDAIETEVDTIEVKGKITKGECQRPPLSPPIFNM